MSLFGQVWLWSLAAFVVGALLTWLVLVLPARHRVRELENRLLSAHADTAKWAPEAAPMSTSVPPPSAAGRFADFTDFASSAPPSGYGSTARFEPTRQPEFEAEPLTGEQPGQLESSAFEAPGTSAVPEPFVTATDEENRLQTHYHHSAREPEHVEPEHVEPEHVEPDYFEPELTQRFGSAVLEPEPVSEPAQPGLEPGPEPEVQTGAPDWFDGDQPPPERSPFDDVPRDPRDPNYAQENPEPETSTYAFAGSDAPEVSGTPEVATGGETPAEATQALPKRQPRQAPPGGFEPPVPIQPSMRTVERREPNSDLTGGYSGSLFEPAVQPGGHAVSAPEPPPAREVSAHDSDVPPGPFGPGSAMPRPGGGRPADDFTVKASVTALRYCAEDSPQFPRMVAEVWFRTATDAERVGFRPLA